MNLFANDTKELLKDYMSEDWAEALSNYLNADAFTKLRGDIGRARRGNTTIFPSQGEVFRALSYPFEKVKVVMIGQDPYHNGNADGLAFSCKTSLSPSLKQILGAMYKDYTRENNMPYIAEMLKGYLSKPLNIKLDYLAEQGVLLYNPTLTVQQGFPGSHKGLWNDFTKAVFQALSTKKHLIWMIWGNDARDSVRSAITLTNPNHLYLSAMHPAAASHQGITWTCDHFFKANEWLADRGLPKINWLR